MIELVSRNSKRQVQCAVAVVSSYLALSEDIDVDFGEVRIVTRVTILVLEKIGCS